MLGAGVVVTGAVDEVVGSGVAVLVDVVPSVDKVVCPGSAVEDDDVGSGVAVLLDAVDEVVYSGSAVEEEVVCSGAVLLDVSSADVLDELVAPSAGPVMARQAISSSGRASFATFVCRRVAASRRASVLHWARAAVSTGHDRADKRPPALRRYRLSRLSSWPTRPMPSE